MKTQVFDSSKQSLDVIAHEADGSVAVAAEQSSHLTRGVVMIDMQELIPLVRASRGNAVTDRAAARLSDKQSAVLASIQPVDGLAVLLAESIDICIAPGLVPSTDAISVGGVMGCGPLPLLYGATPTQPVLSNDRDGASAVSAMSRALGLVDVAEAMLLVQRAGTGPSTIVSLDGDGSAAVAVSKAIQFVEVTQAMLDVSWGVPPEESEGLTLRPPPVGAGGLGEVRFSSASTVACPALNGAVR